MIIKRFKEIVERYEHKIAVKTGEISLTYGELDRKANRMARIILQRYHAPGINPAEQTIALLFNHGINQVISLLAVLKAGKIYIPFESTYPEKRLEFMLEDADARMILTDSHNMELAKKITAGLEETITIIDIDEIAEDNPGEDTGINIEVPADQPAYIIYTSGSTGKPKGVLQICRNVVFYADNYIDALSITHQDRMTFLSSFSHDGAVQDIYGAIFSGATLYPFDIITTPVPETAGHFIKEGLTIYHSVPSVFRYFVGSLTGQEKFLSLRLIVTGGEPLYPGDVTRVREFFPRALLAHMYGQTESSVNTMGFIDVEREDVEISLGEALKGVELLLLDENGEEVLGFETAEIFVSCDHIAPGYWRNPTATAESFMYDEELGKIYRTGDLGRRNYAGSIEFAGRKDNQVKVNGFRVELYEIERMLKEHEDIDDVLVISTEKIPGVSNPEREGDIWLAAYIVSEKERTDSGLRAYLSLYLPDYMIPSYFIFLETLPMGPNGKIDRKALPEPGMTAMTEYMPPRNEVEKKLVDVWSGVFAKEVGINDNFFHLGGDSIKAIQVSTRLREHDLELKISDLFLHPQIKDLAEFVEEIQRDVDRGTVKGDGPDVCGQDISPEKLAWITGYIRDNIPGNPEIEAIYPLTPMQKTMLYYSLSGTNKEVFFIQYLLGWQGTIENSLMETSVNTLVERHDIFRTNFIYEGLDQPRQIVLKHRRVEFNYEDMSGCREEEKALYLEECRKRDRERGFDLSKDMLLRVSLFRVDVNSYYLMWSKHYILMDGWCVGIVFNELGQIYEGLRTGNPIQLEEVTPYRNFVAWLEQQDKAAGFRFWENYLADYHHQGGLVPTKPGPVKPLKEGEYNFETYTFEIAKEEIDAVKQLAADCEVTLNMVFQTLWGILLQKYNNRDDVVFGAVVSGRPPEIKGIENMVGLFINTVPVRVKVHQDYKFSQLLRNMQENSTAAKSYEYLTFTEILAKCELKENIIDNLMTFQNFVLMEQFKGIYNTQGNTAPASRVETSLFHQSNYNFNIIITPFTPFQVTFMYNASAYEEAFLKRIQQHLREILRLVIENKDIQLKDIRVTYDYITAESSILHQEEEEEWNM
ncbi:MAG: amino acid adenylation domain-containing protein [Candidatus Aminicenantes bacterium]|nr:amino acid adenylation domain-containing protein [Candidatus Aminicenantes bacterium]NIM80194.1 amino acid adenylation domain-containing protein [Candidatus Aminicenantes bacterium]NIN16744.1 amino acid adenylation domain-containing protein [Candidatus Aminicenantes bacterium]NIN40600.1 amino acid adenylation domain-containing protein [Candidatus Aminicenantes bacterium]NIN83421.1 amino acid adenylation domain-containing protein [Candidatus Aminicenantes bacterium]